MRTLLIVDVETTGLDPMKGNILELAAVLWCGVELASISSLVAAPSNPAEDTNGISVEALSHPAIVAGDMGLDSVDAPSGVYRAVHGLAGYADIIVAHNNADISETSFDQRFLEAAHCHLDSKAPWLDSHGIEYPVKTKGKSLVELCIAHGVPVTRAHRALTDCRLLARLFERLVETGHDLDAMIDRALRPKVLVQALVSYETNEQAKRAGFRWNPERRMWLRRMPDEDRGALGFETREVRS